MEAGVPSVDEAVCPMLMLTVISNYREAESAYGFM